MHTDEPPSIDGRARRRLAVASEPPDAVASLRPGRPTPLVAPSATTFREVRHGSPSTPAHSLGAPPPS